MQNQPPLAEPRCDTRAARRNGIMDAAIELFARRPFEQIGMRDIAAEAGISAASIYRYFTDRDDLFVAALTREIESIVRALERALARRNGVPIEDIAHGFVDYMIEHDAFFQMMAHFMGSGGLSPAVQARFDATMRSFLDALETAFRQEGADRDARLCAHALFAALNGVLITFRHYPGRSANQVHPHMHRLAAMLAGLFRQVLNAPAAEPGGEG